MQERQNSSNFLQLFIEKNDGGDRFTVMHFPMIHWEENAKNNW